ncbi:MAG: DNA polymerase IV [Patescibacteria group bacterium]
MPILHIDGDAFFASCEQARDPSLKGKPVVTGKERGIAASLSYEAKARGVKRAMPLFEIKKICPDVIILPSDYETYSLLSKRFFEIVRRYTPDVEEYGVDECFADITGLLAHRSLGEGGRHSYKGMAEHLQQTLTRELGFTFSIGMAPSKVLAKVGSKWNKPHGLTVITQDTISQFLEKLSAGDVWGIGPQTAAMLARYRIGTALEFARQTESWITAHLTKPHIEIWHELNGRSVMPLMLEEKTDYESIQKFKTFTPPSTDRAFVFSQLVRNLENACAKARRYGLAARGVGIVLRTQEFRHAGCEIMLERPSALPGEILLSLQAAFDMIYVSGTQYRATGVFLIKLAPERFDQPDLFGKILKALNVRKVYDAVDALNRKYGKYTVGLAASLKAQQFAQHEGERGDAPIRKHELFKGETGRQRLAIPMLSIKI